jgi:hypothetical protein
MRATSDILSLSKRAAAVALRAVAPGTRFVLAFLHGHFASLVTIFRTGPKLVNVPADRPVFEFVPLDAFEVDASNADLLLDVLSEVTAVTDASPAVCRLFDGVPSDTFVHVVVFSQAPFAARGRVSVDWISPVASDGDGLLLSPAMADDFELQIRAHMQRLPDMDFAMDFAAETYAPRWLQIRPASVSRTAIRAGFSQLFQCFLPRTFRAIQPIPIEIAGRFTVVKLSGEVSERLVVFSNVIETTSGIVPLLRAIDPSVACRAVGNLRELIRHLHGFYRDELLPVLPGRPKFDPFFTLRPNLQHFLCVYAYRPKVPPSVSTWESQDIKIDERCLLLLTSRVRGRIVVADFFESIKIFADGLVITNGSNFQKDIQKRVQRRFPVPRAKFHPLLDDRNAAVRRIIQEFGMS